MGRRVRKRKPWDTQLHPSLLTVIGVPCTQVEEEEDIYRASGSVPNDKESPAEGLQCATWPGPPWPSTMLPEIDRLESLSLQP